MRVLTMTGSLRDGSHSSRLLRAAAAALPAAAEAVPFEGLGAVPPYDEDADLADAPPAAVRTLREAIAGADALLVVTPEYNGSVPGVLKNAIDWASRPRAASPLGSLPVAVVSHSVGQFGGLWAAEDLVRVLRIAGARPIDGAVSVPEIDRALSADGRRLVDDELAGRLDALLSALAAEGREREPALSAR